MDCITYSCDIKHILNNYLTNSNYRRCRTRSSRPFGYSIPSNIGKQLRKICVLIQQTHLHSQWDNTLHVMIPAHCLSKDQGQVSCRKRQSQLQMFGSYSRALQDRGIRNTWLSRDGAFRIFFDVVIDWKC